MKYKLENRIKNNTPCGAANGYIAVTPNGDFYPCRRIIYHDFKMGNVNIGRSKNFNNIRSKFRLSIVENREKCSSCWANYICGGNCYANSIEENKEINEIK